MATTPNEKPSSLESVISVIVVLPHNGRYSYFLINGMTEKHIKRIDEVVEFVGDLCPSLSAKIRKLAYDAKPFVLYVEDEEIFEIEEVPVQPPSKRSLVFEKQKLFKNAGKKERSVVEQEQNRFGAVLNVRNQLYRKIRNL